MSRECENCGGHVTGEYARMLEVNGRILGCPDCTEHSQLIEIQKEADDGRPDYKGW